MTDTATLDIDALEAGRKLDELVATQVMGWRIGDWLDETDGGYNLFDKDGSYASPWDAPPDFAFELQPRHRWSPSTDIMAAWQVVESLQKLGFIVEVGCDPISNGGLCSASVFEYDDLTPTMLVEQICNTAPEAICRAALKAVSK